MMVPAYASVTSLSLEKSFYTTDESFKFIGTQDGKDVVFITIRDASKKFMGMLSDPRQIQGEFTTIPRPVTNFFELEGMYNAPRAKTGPCFVGATGPSSSMPIAIGSNYRAIFIASH